MHCNWKNLLLCQHLKTELRLSASDYCLSKDFVSNTDVVYRDRIIVEVSFSRDLEGSFRGFFLIFWVSNLGYLSAKL
jgi:hypothetical protein